MLELALSLFTIFSKSNLSISTITCSYTTIIRAWAPVDPSAQSIQVPFTSCHFMAIISTTAWLFDIQIIPTDTPLLEICLHYSQLLI